MMNFYLIENEDLEVLDVAVSKAAALRAIGDLGYTLKEAKAAGVRIVRNGIDMKPREAIRVLLVGKGGYASEQQMVWPTVEIII